MCGIAGFWNARAATSDTALTTARQMGRSLSHRGPDGEGIWSNDLRGPCLIHRRLAIVDLTSTGHQPMSSSNGRYVMVLNGEIYNHSTLRRELDNSSTIKWRGTSDTEVLLEAISAWGLNLALSRVRGMFAIALYDQQQEKLYLIRDIFGEKPLYYAIHENNLIFASELRAFRCHPSFNAKLNGDALALYFRRGYVPAPLSIYGRVKKVMPNSYICFELGSDGHWRSAEENYFCAKSADYFAANGKTLVDLKNSFSSLFIDVVRDQLQADVPVGVFLSGGIDSSLVAAAAVQSTNNVNTYCIGFEDEALNEAKFAKEVANFLGTNHHEMYLSDGDALSVVGQLGEIYDEPFADASQIPTWWVSKLTRRSCTVALSGDGGDELFGGYQRYQWNLRAWQDAQKFPIHLRRIMASLIDLVPQQIAGGIYHCYLNLRHKDLTKRHKNIDWRLLSEMLRIAEFSELYEYSLAYCMAPSFLDGFDNSRFHEAIISLRPTSTKSELRYMMMHDVSNYLLNDILVKVDRASMANSLESRSPFLDPRVFEFSRRLPETSLINGGTGKAFLRDVLASWIPQSLIDRPKRGFGVPLARWLRGPLKEWANDTLHLPPDDIYGSRARSHFIDMFNMHITEETDGSSKLWTALMYLRWRSGVSGFLHT